MTTLLRKATAARLKVKLPMTMPLAVIWILTVDSLTRIPFGPVSASGALSLGMAALCILLSPMVFLSRQGEWKKPAKPATPLALTIFGTYILVRLGLNPSIAGIQNVAVLTTFILAIGLTAMHITSDGLDRVGKWLRRSAILATLVALASYLSSVSIYGDRTFALAGLIFLAILVPYPSRGLARLAPFLVVGVIALSLSRTALVIAAGMLVFMVVRGKPGFRAVKGIALLGVFTGAIYWLITSYAPLSERFLGSGDGGVVIGNLEFNTSGRANLWDTTITSAKENLLFGHGPGSATELITAIYGSIAHPHNEYLRVLHDFGIVGLVLFTLGLMAIFVRTFARAFRSNHPVHWSAGLAILAVAISAFTDNAIIYPYVMVPLGVLVGASLGMPAGPKVKKVPRVKKLTPQQYPIQQAIARNERLLARNRDAHS